MQEAGNPACDAAYTPARVGYMQKCGALNGEEGSGQDRQALWRAEETTLREVQASPAELTAVRLEVCVHRSQARPREFVALRWLSKDLSLQ